MNDINDIHPGKLKRKTKKSTTPSVVDLPGSTAQTPAGNLLGDVLFDAEESSAIPGSLLDFSNTDASFDDIADVSLKPAVQEEKLPTSPLDLLSSESESFEKKETEKETEKLPVESIAPHRLQKKPQKAKPAAETEAAPDLQKFQEMLNQAKDANQKCLETLARLQNTNVQNERRYAFILIFAFAILAVVTVIGVTIGVNLKNNAKASEQKYHQESYEDALKYQAVLDDENQKNRRGSEAAWEVYQKIKDGLYDEAVDNFLAIRGDLTHPAENALLAEKIDEIQWKLAENAYHDGVMLFNASNFEQARDAFVKSQSYKENTAYSPRLYYYLAMSYYQVGDFEGARKYFALINSSDLSPDMDALMRYYKGICAEKTGNESEAYEYFDQFLKKYRYHRLADEATKHRAKHESAKK